LKRLIEVLHARWSDVATERRLRYLSLLGQLRALVRYRRLPREVFSIPEVRRRRRSDTVFVLGSGPSLTSITTAQWQEIAAHDSFGINYSLLVNFVPTYHLMEDGKEPWLREHLRRVLESRRTNHARAIWFISNRHTRRLIHPRWAPELFPFPPRVCVFQQPARIILDADRPFRAPDFDVGFIYRGTLSVVLYLLRELGYQNIVLLGVDLHTSAHFFDDHPEMGPYMSRTLPRWRAQGVYGDGVPYAAMTPTGRHYRRLDEYLYALDELHFRPRAIAMFVGNRDNMLAPRLPAWNWSAREPALERVR
jgi:hypothetical protein